MKKPQSPNVRDIIYVLALAVSVGVSWGMVATKVSAQEKKVEELLPMGKQLAVLLEKVDSVDRRTTETAKDVRELRTELRSLSRQGR